MGVQPRRHCQAVLDIIPGPLREKSWWTENRDLNSLLSKFKLSEASDPRDNIYALLGISSDAHHSDSLRPDYTKSLQEVIRDTSSFLFGPSDVSYETMPKFLADISIRNAETFLDIVRTSGVSEVDKFLKRRGLDVQLPTNTLRAIRGNDKGGEDIMSYLIRERGQEIVVTKELIDAAAENKKYGGGVMSLLVQRCTSLHDYEELMSAIRAASSRGNVTAVMVLLDRIAFFDSLSCSGNAHDELYSNAFYSASANGHRHLLELLLDRVASFGGHTGHQKDETQYSASHPLALSMASANGHTQVVELLISQGTDVNAQRIYSRDIHSGVTSSRYYGMKLLSDMGAEINEYNRIYINALYLAAANGHEQVVKVLLNNGAEIHRHKAMESDDFDGNAVRAASANGYQKVVTLLLDHDTVADTNRNRIVL